VRGFVFVWKMQMTDTFFEETGWMKTPVYILRDLVKGYRISGPAVIMDELSTMLVEPNCFADITETGDLKVNVLRTKCAVNIGVELDSIQLSIFSHRFMSIAEQMGKMLQRTSISTNIKER